jgi:hypothetical protein
MGKYDINWIKEPTDRKDWFWVERIFCKLGHYYDDYIEDVAEMPFNYTERSILGSLAIAADKCGYYTLLDYSTKVQNGYRYPDFWITLEPIVKRHDVVLEAKRLEKYSFETDRETDREEFRESVTKKIGSIHERLNDCEIGKREKANFQCALLAYQFRIDKDKWRNNNSYDEIWDKLQNDQEQKKGNTKWVDEESICSFWYLYWVPFNKIKNREFKKYYWKPGEKRRQYYKPALGLLIIGSFRKV